MPEESPERIAEKSVIGGCLLSMNARDDVLRILSASNFMGDDLQVIFSTIAEMHTSGLTGIDVVTVAERLEKRGLLAAAGGPHRLVECLETVPHAAHSVSYAEQVLEASQRRAGIRTGEDLIRDSRNKSLSPMDLLAKAEIAIHAAMEAVSFDEPSSISDVLVDALAEMSSGKEVVRHIGTDWAPMDEVTSGIPFGGLVILAARPSMGKTALALSLGLRVAEAGVPTLVCEMEMKKLDLSQRCLAIVTGLDFKKLEKNRLTDGERHQIIETSSMMGKWPLYLDDSCRGQSALSTMIRRMVRRRGVKLVILDYLQLVEPDDKRINREQQVAGITRMLKQLAMQLGIGILCLSQLNREVEKRSVKEPQLSDLRESGAIEQDADQVWFLWRPDDEFDSKGIVKVAKNRNGKTGNAVLWWTPATMRFHAETSDPFQGN